MDWDPSVIMARLALLSLVVVAMGSLATPAAVRRAAGITTLSSSQVSAFKPFSYFAAAGYCGASSTLAWNCGVYVVNCGGGVPMRSLQDPVRTLKTSSLWLQGVTVHRPNTVSPDHPSR